MSPNRLSGPKRSATTLRRRRRHRHDSMLAATLAAANTTKLEVQTSVTIAFPRSPTVLAMEAWDIQHMSKGRFTIGLGSQVKGHNQNRFSIDWPGAAGHAHEGIHPDDARRLEVVPDGREARLRRQVLPLHADDAELQSRCRSNTADPKIGLAWWAMRWRAWPAKSPTS